MRTLAISLHKGGTGKTTTAVNLAALLARRRGLRTLLVDVDAQSNATFMFHDDPSEVEFDLQDVIKGGVPVQKAIQSTRIEGLDLLPATLGLSMLELELMSMTRREDRVRRALAPVADNYDVAVLDLPPSLSLLTIAALSAADDVIAPVSATKFAISGLADWLGWVDDLRGEGVITAPLLDALVTRVDQRTRVAREILGALGESDLPVFETVIPERIAAEDHVGARIVAGDAGNHPDLATAYKALADDVIQRTGVQVRG